MNDKQKKVIKSTFTTLVYTLGEIVNYDQQGSGNYFWVGSMFNGDGILQEIHDLMEAFPDLTNDLAVEEVSLVKSYMDKYSNYLEEKNKKEQKV